MAATAPTDPSAAYWQGAAAGTLVLQRCAACATLRHYPRPMCPRCHSFDVEAFAASGRGEVHSWTVTHHAFDPSVAAEVPYVLVTVDLVEGVRVLGRMVGDTPPHLAMPVTVGFGPGPDGRPRLEVAPATATEAADLRG